MATPFQGLGVALATPFQADGSVDLAGFQRLVKHVQAGGADFLVALGSTGEAATLDLDERDQVIEATLRVAGSTPVVVGTGTNDTRSTARLTQRAKEMGAAGALVVVPFYNKPMPSGIVAHFDAARHAAPGLPIIAYNVPSRTATNMLPDTLQELWKREEIVAVKESSQDLAQIAAVGRQLPAQKTLLSGDDHLVIPTTSVGGRGLISVLGNLMPSAMKALVDHALAGRFQKARAAEARLATLMKTCFVESNPIPVKAGLEILGLSGPTLRLPLTAPTDSTKRIMRMALQDFDSAQEREAEHS